MFEAGKKYQRLVITKKRQTDIAYYECIYVGSLNSLFKTYSTDGNFINEILIPNDNFSRFELFSDDKHRIDYLNKCIKQILDQLISVRNHRINLISNEIKLINDIKVLKTKIDGKERNLLNFDEAQKLGFSYSDSILE